MLARGCANGSREKSKDTLTLGTHAWANAHFPQHMPTRFSKFALSLCCRKPAAGLLRCAAGKWTTSLCSWTTSLCSQPLDYFAVQLDYFAVQLDYFAVRPLDYFAVQPQSNIMRAAVSKLSFFAWLSSSHSGQVRHIRRRLQDPSLKCTTLV
jgi:hypothetical protein